MGHAMGLGGFSRPTSPPARGCPESRPHLPGHSNSAALIGDGLRSCGHTAAADFFLRPDHLWRFSVPSLIRLPADPQPRSACRLVLLFHAIPALCLARGTRVLSQTDLPGTTPFVGPFSRLLMKPTGFSQQELWI